MARGAPPGPGRARRRGRRAARSTSRSWTRRWTTSPRASPTRSARSRACSAAATPGRSPAIPRSRGCREHPMPVLSAAGERHRRPARRRLRRRARCSTRSPRRLAAASSSTRTAPRAAPARACSIRRAWVGEPPAPRDRAAARHVPQLRAGRRDRALGRGRDWPRRPTRRRSPTRLVDAADTAGVDALNIRVHVPGVTPADRPRPDRAHRRRRRAGRWARVDRAIFRRARSHGRANTR